MSNRNIFLTFLSIYSSILLWVWLCSEVQVMRLSFDFAILVVFTVSARVLLGCVPRLLLALMCFGAATAGDAVRIEAVGKRQGCTISVAQCVAAVTRTQDVGVHRTGAAVIVGIRVGAFFRSQLVLRLREIQVLKITVVRTLLALACTRGLVLLLLLLLLLERQVL